MERIPAEQQHGENAEHGQVDVPVNAHFMGLRFLKKAHRHGDCDDVGESDDER